jgi:hypothetical protein
MTARVPFLQAAIDHVTLNVSKDGIPIGSVLVNQGRIIRQRPQLQSTERESN